MFEIFVDSCRFWLEAIEFVSKCFGIVLTWIHIIRIGADLGKHLVDWGERFVDIDGFG